MTSSLMCPCSRRPLPISPLEKMVSYTTLLVVPIVLGILYLSIRNKTTQAYWIKVLFPIGYYLYTTRLGYAFHLRKLNKVKGKGSHSITQATILSPGVKIVPIAVLDDNYSYLIIDTVTNIAAVVDPADPVAVKKCVLEQQASLRAILTTHKHWDHAGGNEVLKRHFPDLEVYGGRKESVAGVTHPVDDREVIKVGNLTFEGLCTPGHTTGHVVYVLQSDPPCLFTGDLIFVCGNGMMFEGNPEIMLKSIKRIMELPKNSLLFPGHEYAWRDVKFALSILPSHTPVQMKWEWVKQQRSRKLATIPSILSEEMNYNPFMATDKDYLKDALRLPQHATPTQVLAELRKQKNAYDPL